MKDQMKGYQLVAHRGLFDPQKGIPENSLPAFAAAVEHGYAIELDVRLSKDNFLVIFHDDSLLRMTGYDKLVKDSCFSEISKLTLKGSDAKIPMLSQVLELVAGRVPLLIELKSGIIPGKLEKLVKKALADYKGAAALQSFHPLSVWWMRRNAPQYPCGILRGGSIGKPVRRFFSIHCSLRALIKPQFYAWQIEDITPALSKKLRGQGHLLLGWTVKTRAQHQKARALCDGMIFEAIRPDGF